LTHHFFRFSDPIKQLQQLAESAQVRTIASTLAGSTPIGQFARDDRPMILMVGNEAQGIDAEIQSLATDRVRIPMQLGTDSLNVSVAAAILMYELTRPPNS
jgi:tRNA G18 (ribose-2'-O)-methylase SpoU